MITSILVVLVRSLLTGSKQDDELNKGAGARAMTLL